MKTLLAKISLSALIAVGMLGVTKAEACTRVGYKGPNVL